MSVDLIERFVELSIGEATSGMRSGEISAIAYMQATEARFQKFRHKNSFVQHDFKNAMVSAELADRLYASGQPMGPLHGIPIAVKDNIQVEGFACSAGTRGLGSFFPIKDAPVVARLRAAGAIIVGTTNMDELALGVTSRNKVHGFVKNAVSDQHIAGGSSGGNGSAVGAGIVPGAIGTDTAGSVRIPAALNGIAGFRPTVGSYSSGGLMPISRTRDTAGPMTRCVSDLALLDAIMRSQPSTKYGRLEPSRLKIGVPTQFFYESLDPEISSSVRFALRSLKNAGVTIVEVDVFGVSTLSEQVTQSIAFVEIFELATYLKSQNCQVDFDELCSQIECEETRYMLENFVAPTSTDATSAEIYANGVGRIRPSLIARYREIFAISNVDALIFPTTIVPAPLLASESVISIAGQSLPLNYALLHNTLPGSSAGLPGVSIPMGYTSAGLPVGLALDGLPGDDSRLLAIAESIEAVLQQVCSQE